MKMRNLLGEFLVKYKEVTQKIYNIEKRRTLNDNTVY